MLWKFRNYYKGDFNLWSKIYIIIVLFKESIKEKKESIEQKIEENV